MIELTFYGVKTYSDPPTYFQGVKTLQRSESTPHEVRVCTAVFLGWIRRKDN